MTQLMERNGSNGGGAMTTGEVVRRGLVVDSSQFANLLDTNRFEHLWRLGQLFASSQMVPAHFQNQPSNCFIALQMAMRMGIDPFMWMQSAYIVHGKPGLEAKLVIALINSSGLFKDPLDYEIEGTDPFNQNYRVRAFATRETTGTVIYGPWIDWKMVKAEGWDSKAGSKWKTMPSVMFQYRAASFFGRLNCPERLMGMNTKEELEDIADQQATQPAPPRGADAVLARVMNRAPTITTADKLHTAQQQAGAPTAPTVTSDQEPEAPASSAVDDPAPAAIEQGDEGQQAPANEESQITPQEEWENWRSEAWSLAQSKGSTPKDFDNALKKCLLAAGKVGKGPETSAEWRTRTMKEIDARAHNWAYLK